MVNYNPIEIPPYTPDYLPIPQVTPFTFRDGMSYVERLQALIKYINRYVLPTIAQQVNDLGTEFETEINALIEQVNAAVEAIITDSIQVQDPVVAGMINDDGSLTSQALNAKYALKSVVDNINTIITTGRLSQAALDNAYGAKSAVDSLTALVTTGRLSDAALTAKISGQIDAAIEPKLITVYDENSLSAAAFQTEDYVLNDILDVPQYPVNLLNGFMINPVWRAAVTDALNTTRAVKVLCVGDSTTSGVGSSGAYSNLNSYPSKMASLMNQNICYTIYGLSVPPSDNDTDSRWVLGSGWTRSAVSGAGLGGRSAVYEATPGSGTLTFTESRENVTSFDIYYLTNQSSTAAGTLTAQAIGGSPTSVNCATGTNGVGVLTVSRTGNNQSGVTISNTGTVGNIWVIGIEPHGTDNRIRVGNAGVSASSTGGWLAKNSGGNNYWNYAAFLPVYDPDLVIIDLGINDAPGTDVATYVANMQQLITISKSAGAAVIVKTMIPSGDPARYPIEKQYVDALKAMSPRVTIIDLFSHYRSYDRTNAKGWMQSTLHGNDTMYADEGRIMAETLFKYSGH